MAVKTTTRRAQSTKGAVAVIERNGKILLQRRREHIADPGTWVLPGGELKRSETPQKALVRVCADELGITVRASQEIGILEIPKNHCPVWHVVWKGKEVALSGEDITGIGWFTPEELMTLEPVRYQEELRAFLQSTDFFRDWKTEQEEKTEEAPKIDRRRVLVLVNKAKTGDHDAFAELYDLFATGIYRYVAFRVPDAIAEDLVSDIFVKAWEKLDSYKGRKGIPFSSWLFRIAHNTVIDSYRTHKQSEELTEVHIDEDRWNDPELKIQQDIQSVILRQAMNKLPKRYREILLMSFMSDLSNTEVARALKVREGSVRILKHRALKKLSGFLPASMRDELP